MRGQKNELQDPSREAGTDVGGDNKTREESLPEFCEHTRWFKGFLSFKLGLASTMTVGLVLYSKSIWLLWNRADLSCGPKIDSQTTWDSENEQDSVFYIWEESRDPLQWTTHQRVISVILDTGLDFPWLPVGGMHSSSAGQELLPRFCYRSENWWTERCITARDLQYS